MKKENSIKDALIGLAIGDALGVPVEFTSRASLKQNPLTGMVGYGSHNQPAGTWSDDSSLTFCLAEMLCNKYSTQDLANRFINWRDYAYWTANDEVFDIGIATNEAISRLYRDISPTQAGGNDENSNGNGSLMRILPLAFYLCDKPIDKRFELIKEVSSLTHAHIRSVWACFIYIEYVLCLLHGMNKTEAFKTMQATVYDFYFHNAVCTTEEINLFERILQFDSSTPPLAILPEEDIHSSGYVLHTLEASLWCILTTTSYKDAVLKAVNLGSDTDTTGAVTGGLAGIIYGYNAIPVSWLATLAKRDAIEDLSKRLSRNLF